MTTPRKPRYRVAPSGDTHWDYAIVDATTGKVTFFSGGWQAVCNVIDNLNNEYRYLGTTEADEVAAAIRGA